MTEQEHQHHQHYQDQEPDHHVEEEEEEEKKNPEVDKEEVDKHFEVGEEEEELKRIYMMEFNRERDVAIDILSQFQKKSPKQPLETADIPGVVKYIREKNVKNIIVMW